jgi:acetylxylan esterase
MRTPSPLALLGALPTLASAAAFTQVTDSFGANPRNVTFNIFVPDVLAASPPILVNPHWCHGTADAAYAGSQWATLASKYGFIVIYPGSPNTADQCWDVSSKETLTHNGGGDSLGIVNMVRWTIDKYKADKTRVFVTGVSSGGMMTEVLVGAYPDVFAAGAAFAGVPFGCFAPANNSGQYDYWNGDCATGKVTHTAQEWGDIARAAYPGYTGWRPKVQIFHGTLDDVVSYVNYGEAVKLWTNLAGIGDTPVSVVANTPVSGWTKSVYGPTGWFEAYSAAGVTHNIQNQEDTVMGMFQLNLTTGYFSWGQGSPSGSTSTSTVKSTSTTSSTSTKATSTTPSTSTKASSTTTSSISKTSSTTSATSTSTKASSTTSSATSTTSAAAACQSASGGAALWAQCGGIGYTGVTTCAAAKCQWYNDWYSQVGHAQDCEGRG